MAIDLVQCNGQRRRMLVTELPVELWLDGKRFLATGGGHSLSTDPVVWTYVESRP